MRPRFAAHLTVVTLGLLLAIDASAQQPAGRPLRSGSAVAMFGRSVGLLYRTHLRAHVQQGDLNQPKRFGPPARAFTRVGASVGAGLDLAWFGVMKTVSSVLPKPLKLIGNKVTLGRYAAALSREQANAQRPPVW